MCKEIQKIMYISILFFGLAIWACGFFFLFFSFVKLILGFFGSVIWINYLLGKNCAEAFQKVVHVYPKL